MFTPKILKNQQFYLSGKTAADAFEAERKLLFADQQLSHSKFGLAVGNAVSRNNKKAEIEPAECSERLAGALLRKSKGPDAAAPEALALFRSKSAYAFAREAEAQPVLNCLHFLASLRERKPARCSWAAPP